MMAYHTALSAALTPESQVLLPSFFPLPSKPLALTAQVTTARGHGRLAPQAGLVLLLDDRALKRIRDPRARGILTNSELGQRRAHAKRPL
jgi:hypothetical protein